MSESTDLHGSVLLVDDDAAVALVLGALLEQAGLRVHTASSGAEALELLGRVPVDVVLSDVRMPGMDGLVLLREVGRRCPGVPVLLLTAHGTVPLAVEAMKAGAADFLLKPFDREEVLFALGKALHQARAGALVEGPLAREGTLLGASRAMSEVLALLGRAAAGNATVLLRGESGTGKELAARELHARSARHAGPFVAVHCAALPEALLESELFGYEKGAFTGAAARKPGRAELAQGGTLFLDEIGDITPAVQVKLLRLLQEKRVERLGGTTSVQVDVRFVAATHRDLEAMVRAGTFREDLYYRLNVVPVWLPPLREHPEDIPVLARHFVASLGAANGKPALGVEGEALELLQEQPWPGNVRQLQNFVERLVVLCDGASLTAADVRRELERAPGALARPASPSTTAGPRTLPAQRRDAEREALMEALRRAKDNRTLAARLLGVSRRTLYNKLEEHGLA